MIQIYDNQESVALDLSFPENGIKLMDFVSKLNMNLNEQGRILTSFQLNDTSFDLSALPEDIFVKQGDRIETSSDSPVSIAKNSILDVKNQISLFIDEIDSIINDLINGDKESSFNKFNIFLLKFKDVIVLFQTLESMFALDFSQIKLNDNTLQSFIEKLIKILTEIKASMESDDLVTLSDLLEYEIKDLFTNDLQSALEVLYNLLHDSSNS